MTEKLVQVEEEISSIAKTLENPENHSENCESCVRKNVCESEIKILENIALVLKDILGCQQQYNGIIADRRK